MQHQDWFGSEIMSNKTMHCRNILDATPWRLIFLRRNVTFHSWQGLALASPFGAFPP
jgi:hypothetical protein